MDDSENQMARDLKSSKRADRGTPFSDNQALINRQMASPEIQQTASDYKNYRGRGDFSEERAFARDNKQYMAKANVLAEASSQAALSKIKSGDVKGAIQEGLKAAAEMGGQLATGRILQFMWLNIYYVLPLLYIDFHFIMRYIAGAKVFCALGAEWSKAQSKTGGAAQTVGKGAGGGVAAKDGGGAAGAAGELAQAPSRMFEILEIIAMVLCNAIVISVLYAVYLLIYAIVTPCETLNAFGGIPGDIASGLLKAIGKCK